MFFFFSCQSWCVLLVFSLLISFRLSEIVFGHILFQVLTSHLCLKIFLNFFFQTLLWSLCENDIFCVFHFLPHFCCFQVSGIKVNSFLKTSVPFQCLSFYHLIPLHFCMGRWHRASPNVRCVKLCVSVYVWVQNSVLRTTPTM